ncbi:MAG: molybdopterin cofactor-binding domain-containing protein [Oscillochloridaceae bacterium umkhey_bin13]
MSKSEQARWRMTRRGFLIGSGIVVGGLALGTGLGLPALRLAVADALEGAAPPTSYSSEPALWFALGPDGRVRLAVPKVEMGQGIHTALAQIAAEELEVAWDQIEVVQSGSQGPVTDPGGTSASNSVASLFTPLREVAATLRELLRAEAAARLEVDGSALTAAAGVFFVTANPEQRRSYGELAAGAAMRPVPSDPPALKPSSAWNLIGSSPPRTDLPAKIRGEATYGYDVRLPGMLYGAVARPPTLGATLRQANPGQAASQPGVVTVVAERGFAGIVAESRTAAVAGVRAMELTWNERPPLQQSQIEALVQARPGQGVVVQRVGDVGAALRNADVISAEYRTPMAAHAHLEPQAALVDVQPDRVIAYVSTQSPVATAQAIAQALGRNERTVEVIPTFLGGGFGRRIVSEVAVEAARLSAAAGRPVHVGWTRTEEFRHGYVRPPTHHVLRGALGPGGRIIALEHSQASGDVIFPLIPAPLRALFGADFGAWRGARFSYAVPNLGVYAERVPLPLETGAWRGLGLLANVFAVESFVDELAYAAGADPLAFRAANAGDDVGGQRLRAVLAAVAERAGWGQNPPPGRARGVACSFDVGTAVAHIAEVSLWPAGGIRVHKVWAAVDPGLPVNPDGIIAQTEGNITMGLSSVLFERLTVRDGQIAAANFGEYPLLAMRDAPEIDVTIIKSSETPHGVGEPPMGPIGAAVANAVFALTGQRLRDLPLAG